jgi:putative transposase
VHTTYSATDLICRCSCQVGTRRLACLQYASLEFGTTLRDSGLVASMGSRGDAFDNALAESFMSTIKAELINPQTWKTRDQARLAVFRYIETFSNPLRRHSALGMHSPDEYEKIITNQTKAATAA